MSSSPIDSIHVSCPHCSSRLKCKPDTIGKNVRCPKCGKQFRVGRDHESRESSSSPPTIPPPIVTTDYATRRSGKAKRTRHQAVITAISCASGLLVTLMLINTLLLDDQQSIRDFDPIQIIGSSLMMMIFLVLYLSPSIVSYVREHQNFVSIMIVNIFFGWTLLGWVICLAWSFSSNVKETRQYVRKVVVKHGEESDF